MMKQSQSLSRSLLTLILLLLFSSCGENTRDYEVKFDSQRYPDAFPTLQNFEKWKDLWIQDSWIVGINQQANKKQTEVGLKNDLIQHFVKEFDIKTSSQFEIKDLLTKNINTEIIIQDSGKKRNNAMFDENIDSVGAISLSNSDYVFQQLHAYSNSAFSKSLPLSLKQITQAQWQSLNRFKQFRFVEPNLMSEVTQQSTIAKNFPNELGAGGNPRVAEVMKQIRFDKVYNQILLTGTPLKQVVVAVIDTGVDHDHPGLKDSMWRNPGESEDGLDNDGNGYVDDVYGIDASLRKNRDDPLPPPYTKSADVGGPGVACPPTPTGAKGGGCGHGSHVSGIIAAKHGDGAETPLGVCPNCKIMALRVAGRCIEPATTQAKVPCIPPDRALAAGEYEDNSKLVDTYQLRALNYILNQLDGSGNLYVNIVNMSLGKYFFNRGMALALRSLKNQGVAIVVAAGNDNTSAPMFPAAYSSAFTVCATSASTAEGGRGLGAKTSFSNFGDHVDICAPGWKIFSTLPGGTNENESGTSQATPIVAGAMGLIRGAFPNEFSLQDAEDRLKKYADYATLYSSPFNVLFGGEQYGKKFYLLGTGILDLEGALNQNRPRSAAFDETEFGQTSQDISGCAVSSLARNPIKSNGFTSMPALLLFSFLLKQSVQRIRRFLGFTEMKCERGCKLKGNELQ